VSTEGLVLAAQSGFFTVEPDGAGPLTCRLRGRLKRGRRTSDLVVIGDRVEITVTSPGEGMIERVLPRRSRLSRPRPGRGGAAREDVVVANVDQLLAVFACAHPAPHLRMLDRFLVAAEYNELAAVVVATKVDLVGEPSARELFGVYEAAGYRVLYTSVRANVGLAELERSLVGRVSALAGPSGAGKSSLLNALQPGLRLATADVSDAVGKGRHTTVMARLLPLDGRGWVADTPGLRELGLWRIPAAALASCFRELRPVAGACQYDDCRHVHEPGCAVREAVTAGTVSAARYDSYLRLLADAA
jgi:ribosome biogenesis GTPase